MLSRSLMMWSLMGIGFLAGTGLTQDTLPPREVKVLPVFCVPKGEAGPSEAQTQRLMRHLEWARTRYGELLPNRATFAIAQKQPRVYRSDRSLAFYRTQVADVAAQCVSELLAELRIGRFTCPYVLLVVMINPGEDFPVGGGRPLNGGFNTGGGIVVLSSFALDRSPNFQSTLQHELGHGFGLPHVDVYGYDQATSNSIMSYNPKHHTKGFTPSPTPGKFLAEDIWGLALNQRAFPKLTFDQQRDVPKGYKLASRLVPLGPMKIPGQPDGVQVTTDAGAILDSKVAHIVQGQIRPSRKTGTVTYDSSTMWHSAKSATGWVSVQVTFPCEVELTRLAVHSQHSGEYHAARAIRVAVREEADNKFRAVTTADLKSVDEIVALPKTKGRIWQLEFQAGEPGGCVVLRGLRFFTGDDELFPPLIPFRP